MCVDTRLLVARLIVVGLIILVIAITMMIVAFIIAFLMVSHDEDEKVELVITAITSQSL